MSEHAELPSDPSPAPAARAQSGASLPPPADRRGQFNEACALALGTAVLASLPTALRVGRAGGSWLGGWLSSVAVLLLPIVLLLFSIGAAGRGYRMLTGRGAGRSTASGLALWIGLLSPGLLLLAAALKAGTNHRGLGGATFGVVALGLAIGSALVARRLLMVGRALVLRGLPARAVALGLTALSIGPLFLVALPLLREPQAEPHTQQVAAAVIDTVIVAVAIAVAAGFELAERPRSLARTFGGPVFAGFFLLGFGWLSMSQPLGVALRSGGGLAAAMVGGLESWTDRDGDGVGAYFGGGDCDEGDPRRHPGADDPPLDGVDQDCDGIDGPPIQKVAALDSAPAAPAAGTSSEPPLAPLPTRPDLILVTLDTVRADRTSAYGYANETTPVLAGLAKAGLLVSRAYAPGSDTQRALMPLFSGRLLEDSPKDRREWPTLKDEADTVAERLQRAGYATAAVSSFQWISKERGFEQGFESFATVYEEAHPERGVTGPLAVRAARSALGKLLGGDKPFYLWVHLFDPHEEYLRHRGFDAGRGSAGAYESELAFTDRQLGDIIQTLDENERGKKAIVIVHGSHGEGFGEHGSRGHGQHLFDEVVRVPLIVRAPGVTSGQSYDASPLSTVDLPATILDLAGLAADGLSGRSLVPLLRGAAFESKPVFSRSDHRVSVVDGSLKLIRTERRGKPRLWLFDLAADPAEKKDLSAERSEDTHRLGELLDTRYGRSKSEKND